MQGILRYIIAGTTPARKLGLTRFVFHRSYARISTHTAPPLIPSSEIRLRDYQEECIQSVLSYLEKGHKRLGVSLATGSGKTVIFTQLINRVKSRNQDAKQTLILVHRKELVEQAARHCMLAYPDKIIDIEMGNSHATGTADITIASIRSLLSKGRIDKFDPGRFKLVLVDEAHHIVAPTYLEVLEYFGLDEPGDKAPALVGVSATFSRFDGLQLGAAIDHIVYHKDYVDMIGEKWLADAIFTTVQSHVDLSKVGDAQNGDFHTKQLSAAVNTDKTNEITVKAWLSRAQERKSTLVFCVDLEHVKCLTEKFRFYGIDARYITSHTSKDIRTQELDAFKNQEYPVLLNCGLFTEGTDIPNIDCVLLARPTRSKNLLIQMIGRGLRLHPGKQDCHVVDMVAALQTGVVTTPTLFGLHPDEGLDKTAVHEFDKIRETTGIVRPKPSDRDPKGDIVVDFTDYDSVHDLIQDTSGERHIRSISKNAWVKINEDRYILASPQGRLDIVRDESGLFSVYKIMALPPSAKSKSPFSRPKEVASSLELTAAVRAADTLAGRVFGPTFVALWQPWRKKLASPGQVGFLKRALGFESGLLSNHITKGQAADMITKLKHGAKGQFKDILVMKRRIDRDKAKEAKLVELKNREQVKVGPLN
ncbi:Putative ATP-dependent helicase IRC3 [Emydomyces testavorans]|uniref:ATP-dependent helicase IRC3 n=1 Tax=Emydomyces testavorans TaxID=2070801 RepID=A0AAF0DG19_9EURO|nr:Putative ATP-dependent helicase IRC3 [Emydomyces testavorans]